MQVIEDQLEKCCSHSLASALLTLLSGFSPPSLPHSPPRRLACRSPPPLITYLCSLIYIGLFVTEDDHTIATLLAAEENSKTDGRLRKRLSVGLHPDLLTEDYNFNHKFTLTLPSATGLVLSDLTFMFCAVFVVMLHPFIALTMIIFELDSNFG
ncbi:hypothetical protein ACOSQ3_005131 [Xanthoceras sorbifolium]